LGDKAPPAVVINGGCAMTIPGPPVQWPLRAVTILILGGADYFRGRLNGKDYVASTSNRVPQGNSSTAILYIREMDHMPQSSLMQIILQPLLLAAIYWKSSGRPPVYELHNILKDLEIGQWSGSLSYLEAQGKWKEISFGGIEPDQSPTNKAKLRRSATSQMQSLADQELARANELERLVAEKEEELRLLRGQLADSKEKARRLSEAARREEMSSTPTPSPGEERPVVGQRVQYWSVSQTTWLDCDIIAVRQRDGAVQVSVKPDYWLHSDEKATKIRVPGAGGSPPPPTSSQGAQLPNMAKASWSSTVIGSPASQANNGSWSKPYTIIQQQGGSPCASLNNHSPSFFSH